MTCIQPKFSALPPGQVVHVLADRGLYNSSGGDFAYGSERSFYRVLHANWRPNQPPWGRKTTTGTKARAAAQSRRTESGVELGHHFLANNRARYVVVHLRGDRCLERQGRDLGKAPSTRSTHSGGYEKQGLSEGADQQKPPPTTDPAGRQRQLHARCHAEKPTGGTGWNQILLQAACIQRQNLLGIGVPHGKYWHGYPRGPFGCVGDASQCVASFVVLYNHQYRHSGI